MVLTVKTTVNYLSIWKSRDSQRLNPKFLIAMSLLLELLSNKMSHKWTREICSNLPRRILTHNQFSPRHQLSRLTQGRDLSIILSISKMANRIWEAYLVIIHHLSIRNKVTILTKLIIIINSLTVNCSLRPR